MLLEIKYIVIIISRYILYKFCDLYKKLKNNNKLIFNYFNVQVHNNKFKTIEKLAKLYDIPIIHYYYQYDNSVLKIWLSFKWKSYTTSELFRINNFI